MSIRPLAIIATFASLGACLATLPSAGIAAPRLTTSGGAIVVLEPAARRGPPWISIEYPPSPYDATTRSALLLVHAFHHGTPVDLPVRGTAEGVVDGKRRTVSLEFRRTSRTGVYALTRQWPSEGRWVLSLGVVQGEAVAGALVTLDAAGHVASVTVPMETRPGWEIAAPRAITAREVELALR